MAGWVSVILMNGFADEKLSPCDVVVGLISAAGVVCS